MYRHILEVNLVLLSESHIRIMRRSMMVMMSMILKVMVGMMAVGNLVHRSFVIHLNGGE